MAAQAYWDFFPIVWAIFCYVHSLIEILVNKCGDVGSCQLTYHLLLAV